MYSAQFWKATVERVVATFLEVYLALWLVGDVALDVFTFDWLNGLGVALGAALLSLVKCVLAALRGNPGPSMANETLSDYPNPGVRA